jgi:hypothetical protein
MTNAEVLSILREMLDDREEPLPFADPTSIEPDDAHVYFVAGALCGTAHRKYALHIATETAIAVTRAELEERWRNGEARRP